MKIREDILEIFWGYIKERNNIYVKKEIDKLPPPWTDDPILKKYKFTNVFRELDPGTKYVIENMTLRLGYNDPHNLIFNCIVYRLYNKIETMQAIGLLDYRNFDREELQTKLETQAKIEPVFTGAFMVSAYNSVEGDTKIERTTRILQTIASDMTNIGNRIITNHDSFTTYRTILNLFGFGEFLAYQIAVDLGYYSNLWFDENEFVIAGPGAKRGIDLIYSEKSNMSYEDCIRNIELLHWEEFIDEELEKPLNIMAIENCLCEFSKYYKAYTGKGRPRNKYKYSSPVQADILEGL